MKKLYQSAAARAAASWAVALYVRFVARTVRWRIEGLEEFLAASRAAPVIVVFWHEALPSMPVFWARARAGARKLRPAVVLASRHRDGQLIGNVARHMGIGVISGSSSRGGAAALRALARAVADGKNIGLTPDGPRGPRRVCAPGVVQLAALTGSKIVACGAVIVPAKEIRTWDRTKIPAPFGRGALVCAAPIGVAREGWEQKLPEVAAAMDAAMDRAAALLCVF